MAITVYKSKFHAKWSKLLPCQVSSLSQTLEEVKSELQQELAKGAASGEGGESIGGIVGISTMWGPRLIAKLVYNSNNYGL